MSRLLSHCQSMRPAMVTLLLISMVGCSSATGPNAGRYKMRNDAPPLRTPTVTELRDAVPRAEPVSRQGNRTYELFGQTYDILDPDHHYEEVGVASWYGRKFHGHLTANGEFYDMFSMSAAHKTLPLPSYVRVTNLSNQKSVIVRVNDRGPFHGDRVLDLSYAAAFKIGVVDTGTAQVKIETVEPTLTPLALANAAAPAPNASAAPSTTSSVAAIAAENVVVNETENTVPPEAGELFYLQVMASSDLNRLQQEADALSQLLQLPATTAPNDGLYRLMLGPVASSATNGLIEQLKAYGYNGVFRVIAP